MTQPDMTELILSVWIPTVKVSEVINGVARQLGWTDEIEDEDGNMIPNPISKGQYIKNHILGIIKWAWTCWNDELAKQAALASQDEDGSDFE